MMLTNVSTVNCKRNAMTNQLKLYARRKILFSLFVLTGASLFLVSTQSMASIALAAPISTTTVSVSSNASSVRNISFSDNQTIPVTLSDTNLNRLVVTNDQISNILCPSGFCISKHNATDQSGAVYIKLLSTSDFTLFISTAAGHHVSLQVTPKVSNGKTIVLNPVGANLVAKKWETQSSYQRMLVALIKDMMNNKVPSGFGYTPISHSAKERVFNGLGTLQMSGVWTGNYLIGLEYIFKNKTEKSITIPDSAFYHRGVRLVAQTSQTVSPGDYNVVYEITSRGQS